MNNSQVKYYILLGVASVIAVVAYSIIQYKESNNLPILSEKIGNENGQDVYQSFEVFSGFDQNGSVFNNATLNGKVHVANFFFCSCPVVCPKMTVETKLVMDAIGDREDFLIVSYSIDPKRDSIPKLKNFADRFEVTTPNWHFVNVGKESVYKLARNSYKIVAVQGNEESNDFIHSELLTLVDQESRVRGYYDSTEPEEIEKLINDINKLL